MVDNPQSDGVLRFVVKRCWCGRLGHMGHAFAVNLAEDGYQVLAYDRDPKWAAALTGARPAAGFCRSHRPQCRANVPSRRRRACRGGTRG